MIAKKRFNPADFFSIIFISLAIMCGAVYGQTEELLLKGVNIVDTKNGTILREMDVLLKDGKINSITLKQVPKMRAKVVNAAGKYLIPGLFDMHVHLRNSERLSFN